jgi:hypothetical protein
MEAGDVLLGYRDDLNIRHLRRSPHDHGDRRLLRRCAPRNDNGSHCERSEAISILS